MGKNLKIQLVQKTVQIVGTLICAYTFLELSALVYQKINRFQSKINFSDTMTKFPGSVG